MNKTLSSGTRLYHIAIPIIGLTGGIATGKSTVANMLREREVPLICADALVKSIYQTNEAVEFISKIAPNAIDNNKIDFSCLREMFFHSDSFKLEIETFIYSRLEAQFKRELTKFTMAKHVIYDAPVLFEKDLADRVDLVVCVYAPRKVQLERLIARDGSSEDLANKILDAQYDIEEKKHRADIIVHNTGDLTLLEREVDNLIPKFEF